MTLSKKHILLLGSKNSGKQATIETLTQRKPSPRSVLLMGKTTLPSEQVIALYSINPKVTKESVLTPVLNVANGALIMVNAASVRAIDDLTFFLDYTQDKQINQLAIGVWQESTKEEMINIGEIFNLLDKRNLMLPVVTIEDKEKDDMYVALESVIAQSEDYLAIPA